MVRLFAQLPNGGLRRNQSGVEAVRDSKTMLATTLLPHPSPVQCKARSTLGIRCTAGQHTAPHPGVGTDLGREQANEPYVCLQLVDGEAGLNLQCTSERTTSHSSCFHCCEFGGVLPFVCAMPAGQRRGTLARPPGTPDGFGPSSHS